MIEAPSDTKDKCTHLNFYQKSKTTIDTCKPLNKDNCKAVGIKGFAQKFGRHSGCSDGGALTDKGEGFN